MEGNNVGFGVADDSSVEVGLGPAVGVLVGPSGVFVGGTVVSVTVGVTGVLVGVSVGGTGVPAGGTGVLVEFPPTQCDSCRLGVPLPEKSPV